jgi:hypothetical protein
MIKPEPLQSSQPSVGIFLPNFDQAISGIVFQMFWSRFLFIGGHPRNR